MTTAKKIIEGRVVTVEVGSRIERTATLTDRLLPCDDWDQAAFRWPNSIREWRGLHDIACNVEITGRTFQDRGSCYGVKVRFTWVGDGEPNTYSEGWLLIDSIGSLPYAEEMAA